MHEMKRTKPKGNGKSSGSSKAKFPSGRQNFDGRQNFSISHSTAFHAQCIRQSASSRPEGGLQSTSWQLPSKRCWQHLSCLLWVDMSLGFSSIVCGSCKCRWMGRAATSRRGNLGKSRSTCLCSGVNELLIHNRHFGRLRLAQKRAPKSKQSEQQ